MVKIRPVLAVLLIAAFLCVRMIGTHLHLCLDGTEPPTSFQSQTHDLSEDFGHNKLEVPRLDFDIDLVGDLLTKLAKAASDLPVLIVAVALFFLAPRRTPEYVRPTIRGWAPDPRSRIRPPLRAPPR